MDWVETTARRDEKHVCLEIGCTLYYRFGVHPKNGIATASEVTKYMIKYTTPVYLLAIYNITTIKDINKVMCVYTMRHIV